MFFRDVARDGFLKFAFREIGSFDSPSSSLIASGSYRIQ